jgi:hypothetical protein
MTAIRALPAVALCAAALAANAGIVVLTPIQDNTLYEYVDPTSNGAGQHCFTGLTGEPTSRRTLIAFDVHGSVPADVHIQQVVLTLNMSKTIAGPTPVSVHRVLTAWGEGDSDATGEEGTGAPAQPDDATWTHTFYDTYYWAAPGGDYDPTPSDTISVDGEGPYEWSSFHGLLTDVSGWYDGSANYGWILIGDESGPITAKRFDTREHPDPQVRPRLLIAFTPPCFADWNMDGLVDTRDVLAFLNEWVAGYHSADLDQSGNVNTYDVVVFFNAWNAGCP